MKITTESFKHEYYYCRECDANISQDQLDKSTWRCECGKKIIIEVPREETISLVRLLPEELEKQDAVFDQYTFKFYNLKGISEEGTKYRLGIAGHGNLKINEDEFINCMWNDQ